MDYAPFVLSAPHFYGSPEILRMSVGGLSEPSLDRHGTFYDVEPETGTVIRFKRRWQVLNESLRKSDQVESVHARR